ncbi:DNA cytosine methyltransferase [Chryseobacterium zhengzhouense]|uniref:DNA (cytosine-5-)-methyltransferase n=1 Tax=Chryseobacterium zhengzhouense TaxID=1636086 RepID=A0ABW2M1L1_9FLAO
MRNKYIKLGALAITLLYVDLFCGAGGTSTGVETAKIEGEKCAKVIACVNHDPNAIASHAENHPESVHYTEDIRTLELSPLVEHALKMRKEYPFAKLVLWASLECTNFSKAKGGLARDADSRTLADHLDRYVIALNPDSIQIENVEEFMSWGDLDNKGKPISKDKGRLYLKWVDHIKKFGYKYDYRILNSADFGALTSRKRFFAQFNNSDFPIVWPEPTHAKNPVNGLFESLEKWRPVKEVLDFNDEGESIFTRKKPLVEATLERIYHGLIKFVAGGKDKWLLKYNSVNGKTRVHVPPSVDDPCPTVSCQGRLGVVSANFLAQYNSGNPEQRVKSIDDVCNTVTTNNRFAKVECNFLSKYFSGKPEHKNITTLGPCGTIKTKDSHALVQPKFIQAYYGNGFVSSVESPAPTVTTSDRFSLVDAKFIFNQYGNSSVSSIEKPSGTLTTSPKQNLVTCENWILNSNFKNVGSTIEDPAPVITANRKWHYLMDAQYSRVGNSIDQPCFTLIARMDKTPPYLVEISDSNDLHNFIKTDGNIIVYEIYETDSPMMQKIKEFMAYYGLMDIKMRMLKIQELKEIMGFPKDYVLIGTQADQKKFIGNAVEVTMARKICEATAERLILNRKAA